MQKELLKTTIYDDYSAKIYGYFLGKTQDEALADELRGEVFLKIVAGLDSFDETKASLSTWIYHIAQNTLTDHFRTRKVTEDIDGIAEPADGGDTPEESLCKSESLEELADALEALEPRLRDIVILHYYDGITLKDIAVRMGISYNYAKILHSKALAGLREKLDY